MYCNCWNSDYGFVKILKTVNNRSNRSCIPVAIGKFVWSIVLLVRYKLGNIAPRQPKCKALKHTLAL